MGSHISICLPVLKPSCLLTAKLRLGYPGVCLSVIARKLLHSTNDGMAWDGMGWHGMLPGIRSEPSLGCGQRIGGCQWSGQPSEEAAARGTPSRCMWGDLGPVSPLRPPGMKHAW